MTSEGLSKGMVVYSKQEWRATCSSCLQHLRAALAPSLSYQDIVGLLIDYGEFESAVVDALAPFQESEDAAIPLLRRAAFATGHALYQAWKGNGRLVTRWLQQFGRDLDQLAATPLPETVFLRVAEGYAHYGLYPETYLEAAQRFFQEKSPGRVVCLGVRSIGTSLSAVIGATLKEQGVEVSSFTVRPRGEPFDRRLVLSHALEQTFRSQSDAYFAIADEGPGLSGVTICSVAQRLSELGIPDERIVLFPSWVPDGASFLSDWARRRWQRHAKYACTFDEVLLQNSQFTRSLFPSEYVDLSCGAWRPLFYLNEADYPAVHPYHERRKLLCGERTRSMLEARSKADAGSALYLGKFVGLGRYGLIKRERAMQLADAGFAPPVAHLANGFLYTRFVPGQPLSGGAVEEGLLNRIASYLAFRRRHLPSPHDGKFDQVVEMIRTNVAVGLGDEWLVRLNSLETFRSVVEASPTAEIDGRMLPHEWIATPQGYLKTDGVDHDTHQFFRGCQDIAWDIAGTCVEFELTKGAQAYLIRALQSQANDVDLGTRLPFYFVAYLAYRYGYAELAVRELGASPDGQRFGSLANRYAARLKQEIAQMGTG